MPQYVQKKVKIICLGIVAGYAYVWEILRILPAQLAETLDKREINTAVRNVC